MVSGRPINFRVHEIRAGNVDGARADFEKMLAQLVGASNPNVRRVHADPGDWGIDCFVGSLAGTVVVWQSKYFIDGIGKSQQKAIREALESLMKNAKEKHFTVDRWVLCIPVSMNAEMTRWWDGYKKRTETKHGIEMELWDETELERLLISPDAAHVRAEYYGTPGSTPTGATLPVLRLTEPDRYESALFVKQMREAGHVELTSCKEQFFNAEIVVREVHDKGVVAELEALVTADAHVHAIWETRYNAACEAADGERRLPGLHQTVMLDAAQAQPALPRVLRLGPVHAMGLVHRTVEEGRAGWVRDFRSVADAHRRMSAAPTAAQDPQGVTA